MTEQAPHMNSDLEERFKRLSNRSAEDSFFETVGGAMIRYKEEVSKEAEQWKNAYNTEKAKNEYLVKLLEQNGISVPDFSLGVPPSIPAITKNRKNALSLPSKLDTERSQKFFKKALDRNYMQIVNGKIGWVGTGDRGTNSQLAYFCGRIYNYENSVNGNVGENFPESELCEFFGLKRLYGLLTQVYDSKKKQSWRSKIDDLFDDID